MKEEDELKNFWNDKKKIEKAEKEISKEISKEIEPKKDKKIFIENENINNMNFNNANEKDSKLPLLILIILFICAILVTFIVIDKINENEKTTQNKINEEKTIIKKQYSQNQSYEKVKRNDLKLDNNLYSDNLYKIQNEIYNNYKDSEFVKNLEPFFNNLTIIELPKDNKIYEFEIKGIISKYGNFSYVPYTRTNILEYDNAVIRELERLRKIKFREQTKDIDFSLTVTNKYKLIN